MGIAWTERDVVELMIDACTERRRWEFMLTLAPLPLRGAIGSPVNPIALF
jgi:hypothetical protein